MAVNWKNGNVVTIFRHNVIVKHFWRFFFLNSLVKFSYQSKFHVNIIDGSGVMTISFYKELTRNPEIGNIPVWVLPNMWRLGRVRNNKFGTNISNKILPNAAKCQGNSFYRFWVVKEKPTGGRGIDCPLPTQIRVNNDNVNLVENFNAQSVEINFYETLMFLYMQKNQHRLKTILGTLGMLDHLHQNHTINLQQAFMPICVQKINFLIQFFLKICK